MQDIRRKFQQIATERTKLDVAHPEGCVYVTSEENPDKNSVAGVTMHVTNQEAAKQLVDRTAHLSTQEEIDAFVSKSREAVAKLAEAEMRKNPLSLLVEGLQNRQQPAPAAAPAKDAKK